MKILLNNFYDCTVWMNGMYIAFHGMEFAQTELDEHSRCDSIKMERKRQKIM